MIIDTHCHLIDEAFSEDVDAVIGHAQEAGVRKMILACCDEGEFPQIMALCQRYPDTLYPIIGIHPENIAQDVQAQFDQLYNNIYDSTATPAIRAVGEIGIDLHWDKTRLDDQLWILTAQVDWALEHDLPILLHIRDAMSPFLEHCRTTLYPLAQDKGKQLRGILHCYSGTIDEAQEAQKYGDFLLGIGGTLTYKKSSVPDMVKAVGIDHLVLETDAPYLAPMPHRGHRNEPAYTALTCQALAEILNIFPQEVAEITTRNAMELLNI